MKNERWIIGPEFDAALVASVRLLLRRLGYEENDFWNGIGGSQEISCWEYVSGKGRLRLESETYIGLILEGADSLVTEVREALDSAQQQKSRSEKH